MSWAITIVENPDPTLDFSKVIMTLPATVADAIFDHLSRIADSTDPCTEFAESNSLMIFLLQPGAVASVLTVTLDEGRLFRIAIPFQCGDTPPLGRLLHVEGLWVLEPQA